MKLIITTLCNFCGSKYPLLTLTKNTSILKVGAVRCVTVIGAVHKSIFSSSASNIVKVNWTTSSTVMRKYICCGICGEDENETCKQQNDHKWFRIFLCCEYSAIVVALLHNYNGLSFQSSLSFILAETINTKTEVTYCVQSIPAVCRPHWHPQLPKHHHIQCPIFCLDKLPHVPHVAEFLQPAWYLHQCKLKCDNK